MLGCSVDVFDHHAESVGSAGNGTGNGEKNKCCATEWVYENMEETDVR